MSDFLRLEYEQCLSLIKYYEERQLSLLKFASGLASGVLAALFGFGRIERADINWVMVGLVAGFTATSLMILFAAMVQNRLYFVFPTRQVNALRAHFLAIEGTGFKSEMFTSRHVAAFKLLSVQTLLGVFVALEAGGFTGLLSYAALSSVACSVLISLIATVFMCTVAGAYLWYAGSQEADWIHRRKRK